MLGFECTDDFFFEFHTLPVFPDFALVKDLKCFHSFASNDLGKWPQGLSQILQILEKQKVYQESSQKRSGEFMSGKLQGEFMSGKLQGSIIGLANIVLAQCFWVSFEGFGPAHWHQRRFSRWWNGSQCSNAIFTPDNADAKGYPPNPPSPPTHPNHREWSCCLSLTWQIFIIEVDELVLFVEWLFSVCTFLPFPQFSMPGMQTGASCYATGQQRVK